MFRLSFFVCWLMMVILSGCNQPAPKKKERLTDEDIIAKKIQTWSVALKHRKYDDALKIYQPYVMYYGKRIKNTEAVELEKKPFADDIQYTQFVSDISIKHVKTEGTRVTLRKQTVSNSEIKIKYMFFVFQKKNNDWLAALQGDSSADKMIREFRYHHIPLSQIRNCEKAAEAILLSSPRVNELLIEENSHYRLELYPHQKTKEDNNYWFWIYILTKDEYIPHPVSRFSVNSKTGLLSEFDEATEKSKVLSSDKRFNKFLKRFCR